MIAKKVYDFYTVIITKNLDADAAETDGLTLAETAEIIFEADRSLGGRNWQHGYSKKSGKSLMENTL